MPQLCTIPNRAALENLDWDRGAIAFEAQILQPLIWFGSLIVEQNRTLDQSETYLYRKSQIFDRCLEFNLKIER
jgi:hypothetical protein